MTEREAFIESIAANPDDDTARLAFADWLQEHGEETRAEFIRLRHEMRRNVSFESEPSAEFLTIEAKAWALFEGHVATWLDPFCRALGSRVVVPRTERWPARLLRRFTGRPSTHAESLKHFRYGWATLDGSSGDPVAKFHLDDGFVSHLQMNLAARRPIADLAAAFRLEPVSSLWLEVAARPDQWPRLNVPALSRVSRLTVVVPDSDPRGVFAATERVLSGPHWSGVTELRFNRFAGTFQPAPPEYIEGLARSLLLPQLEGLSVCIEQVDLRPLTTNPRLANLRRFEASSCHVPGAGELLASATFRTHLEELALFLNYLGDTGARTLGSVAWPTLRVLDLSGNQLTDAAVQSLLPLVPQLGTLDVSHNAITDAGARALADAVGERSCGLCLSHNPLSASLVNELRARFGAQFWYGT